MFSIADKKPAHDCHGHSRREFLKIGSLGFAGLSLPQLLAAKARAVESGKGYLRDRSVVLLFLQGGPPHIEFFDPKMSAPAEIHSCTGEIATKHAGVTFGATFPKLAAMADEFSVLRNYGSGNSGHTYGRVVSAGNPTDAAMSVVYSRIRGANHPVTGMPTNILVKPEAVLDGLKLGSNFETGALPTLTQTGNLGPTYAAFDPSGGGELQKNMELKITADRLADRRGLLGNLDQLRRQAEVSGAIDGLNTYQQQAFEMIVRGVADAFDLTQEDPTTFARYDTSKLFKMEDLTRYYDMRRASNQLGRQMLLARRLCEAGCGFVTVSDCGWDYHANNNSPKNMTGIYPMGHQVDHAVSAFIEDLRERGLSDKILLVVTGEMGRTPRRNGNGGRDHYGELTSLLLSGGGLKMGQVIGQSDSQAGRAIGTPYRPEHVLATIMHSLFDIGELRLDPSLPRDIIRVTETGEPIHQLI